jgi:branched-chain amino acid transport system ATP-binding protein
MTCAYGPVIGVRDVHLAPAECMRPIFERIKIIREEGATVVLVEQNANMALRVADYAYVLAGRRVAAEGLAEAISASGAVERSYLGA